MDLYHERQLIKHEMRGFDMIHFIFMILPGLLSFTIFNENRAKNHDFNYRNIHYVNKVVKNLILMILLVNIVGLYLGKILFGAQETFVDGQLNPNLLSLGYLVLITGIAIILGKAVLWYHNNFRIYFSRDKMEKGGKMS